MSNSFTTPWTVARQAPLSMGFSRQEYWSGFAVPSTRGSSWLNPSLLCLLHWQTGSLPLAPSGKPSKPLTPCTGQLKNIQSKPERNSESGLAILIVWMETIHLNFLCFNFFIYKMGLSPFSMPALTLQTTLGCRYLLLFVMLKSQATGVRVYD